MKPNKTNLFNKIKNKFLLYMTRSMVGICGVTICILIYSYLIELKIINLEPGFFKFLLEEFLPKIAELILVGVVFTFLTSSQEIVKIYREELLQLIYFEDVFLDKRNDIEEIWKKVTNSFFKQRFSRIKKDLVDLIINYIPDHKLYYKDFKIKHIIEWDKDDPGYIIVREESIMTIMTDTNEVVEFSPSMSVNVNEDTKNKSYIKLISLKINKEELKDENGIFIEVKNENEENKIFKKIIKTLSGENCYSIERIIEKKYNIDIDKTICFRAKYIIENLTAMFDLPMDISLDFFSNGTEKNFFIDKLGENSWVYSYNGLILPKHGYSSVVRRTNKIPTKIDKQKLQDILEDTHKN